MSEELMNTKEVAKYLDIHEKQVYALIKSGRLPGTRVTGKWIFPRHLIERWIEEQAKSGLAEARRKGSRVEGALLAAGSNDPVLDILLNAVRSSNPDFYVFTASTGSTEGLKALDRGYVDVAWSHLLDPADGRYNTPAVVSPFLRNLQSVVVHLFNRDIGFLASRENSFKVCGIADIVRNRMRIVNRQEGSGTRILLDYCMKNAGVARDLIPGYDREVFTHMEIGLAILSGEADTGIASSAVARLLDLEFTPLATESFDMILARDTFFSKGVQAFLEGLSSDAFRKKVKKLGGYGFKNSGLVLHAAC